jgi:hypothetical protein
VGVQYVFDTYYGTGSLGRTAPKLSEASRALLTARGHNVADLTEHEGTSSPMLGAHAHELKDATQWRLRRSSFGPRTSTSTFRVRPSFSHPTLPCL